ncbi:MAG: hypothetical protein ACNI27_13070 [Desulfovibrio sp.]
MGRRLAFIFLWGFVSVLLISTFSRATDLPRLMVVGEDSDRDSVKRGNRVFVQVQNAMVNSLLEEGFDVRDETALTLDSHEQGKSRRTDGELIQIARDVGVDTLMIFTLYPKAQRDGSVYKVSGRVTGRLLSVNDGSRMGNFEITPMNVTEVPKPKGSPYNAILEALGRQSSVLAREVADVLTRKLARAYDGADGSGSGGKLAEWTLEFDGFSPSQMLAIEDYLVQFSGYDSYRLCSSCLNTNKHHTFWYRSSIDSTKMRRNMYKLMDKLKHEAVVQFGRNKVSVKRIPPVKQKPKASSSEW